MKTQSMFKMLLVNFLCVLLLCGCSNGKGLYDNGVTNEQGYEDYQAWEKANEIRLILGISIEGMIEEDHSDIITEKSFDIPNKYDKKIEELREGIISFFNERYHIDVSELIGKQQIAIYTADGINEGVFGYVEPTNQHILNLNRKIFKEESDKFETTYIHETLHQIGFFSKTVSMLDEGITDALTDMICCYMGKSAVSTEYYFESRTLAYQMLKADPEIVKAYLTEEDFCIRERINEKLKDVPQVYEKTDNLGVFLDHMIKALYDLNTGIVFDYGYDPYIFAFQAQEIVKAYCQECNPDTATINYIRAHYLTIDCETVTVKEDSNGYYFE